MAQEPNAPLVPSAEQTVDFYGDPIPVAVVDQQAYVPLRDVTQFLGLNWSGQRQRTQRHEILSKHVQEVMITALDGKQYAALCLELEYFPGWLFGISASRVNEEWRETVLRYQEESFLILWNAVQDEMKERGEALAPTSRSAPLAHIRSLGLAIAQLAEEQMELEGRVSTTEGRLDRAAMIVREIGQRVAQLEERVSPAALVTEEQAGEIATQVRALAQLLTERDPSKNHFAGVYSELYRRFGVSSYKNIRQDRYEEVLTFLEAWRAKVVGEG